MSRSPTRLDAALHADSYKSQPRFERQSFASQHWPLAWIALLLALMVWFGSFLLGSVNGLGHHFKYQADQITVDFNKEHSPQTYGLSRDQRSLRQIHEIKAAKNRWSQLDAFRETFRVLSIDLSNVEALTETEREKQYVQWHLHRQTGFAALQYEQLDLAKNQFEQNLSLANALGRAEPMIVQSKLDLAWINTRLLLEYEYRAAVLRLIALPCFSLVAAFLPFLLMVRFLRKRKYAGQFNDISEENFSEILWVKVLTAVSWSMAIGAAWVALRNYAFGVDDMVLSAAVNATIFSLIAMALGLTLLLRYMPPTRNLTVRAMLIQCGFGGLLLSLKATGIYMALCLALASHPGINQFLFLSNARDTLRKEVIILAQAAESDSRALARVCTSTGEFKKQISYIRGLIKPETLARTSLDKPTQVSPFPQVTALAGLKASAASKFDQALQMRITSENISNRLLDGASAKVMVSSSQPRALVEHGNGKACWLLMELFCLFTLIVYPESLAYIFSIGKNSDQAKIWFERAVRVKTYVLGENHWHIASMHLTFGQVLIADYQKKCFDHSGEEHIREAIRIYEIACGRHAEETLAAKLVLARFYQKRENSDEAEKILLEAKQDAGSNLELVPYCRLLSQLGAIYLSQQNLPRAKSIYREQIELLTKALEAHPVRYGFFAMFCSNYKSQAGWQIESTLIMAQLGLAEVYARMRYEGEVERLINDAVSQINRYSFFFSYYEELTEAYVRAHTAQANLFLRQGKLDQALKTAADACRRLEKTSYISRPYALELLALTNKLRFQKMDKCGNMEKREEERKARQTFELFMAAKYSSPMMFMSPECIQERKNFDMQIARACPQDFAAVSQTDEYREIKDPGFSIKYDKHGSRDHGANAHDKEGILVRVRK